MPEVYLLEITANQAVVPSVIAPPVAGNDVDFHEVAITDDSLVLHLIEALRDNRVMRSLHADSDKLSDKIDSLTALVTISFTDRQHVDVQWQGLHQEDPGSCSARHLSRWRPSIVLKKVKWKMTVWYEDCRNVSSCCRTEPSSGWEVRPPPRPGRKQRLPSRRFTLGIHIWRLWWKTASGRTSGYEIVNLVSASEFCSYTTMLDVQLTAAFPTELPTFHRPVVRSPGWNGPFGQTGPPRHPGPMQDNHLNN